MHNTTLGGIAAYCRGKGAFRSSASILLACCALALSGNPQVAAAQDSKPAAMPVMPSAPSAGKALICIYRTSRFTGSAAHDHLYVNGVYLATLLNGEYAWSEVAPGAVVISGLPKMYYGGIIQSTGAALNEATKKENERIRFDVEAGKTYYLKWTSGAMATGIKVTPVDEATGAREMSKLHPSKAPSEKDEGK
jgi:hypothetical protein